jgi:hypothetical protein
MLVSLPALNPLNRYTTGCKQYIWFIRNVAKYLRDYMGSHPRIFQTTGSVYFVCVNVSSTDAFFVHHGRMRKQLQEELSFATTAALFTVLRTQIFTLQVGSGYSKQDAKHGSSFIYTAWEYGQTLPSRRNYKKTHHTFATSLLNRNPWDNVFEQTVSLNRVFWR